MEVRKLYAAVLGANAAAVCVPSLPCSTRNSTETAVKRAVILGVGNVLLTDDGAGVHAARVLQERLAHHTAVTVLDAGTLSFTLAPLIENAQRLIILDAAQLQRPPGSIQCFLNEALDGFLSRGRLSVHEIGLRDLLDIARLAGKLPRQRALIGIQPQSLGWGTEPTPPVAAALDAMIQSALELIDAWPDGDELGTPDERAGTHERLPSHVLDRSGTPTAFSS